MRVVGAALLVAFAVGLAAAGGEPTPLAWDWTASYEYDAVGNLLSATGTGGDYWMDCTGIWNLLSRTTTSTTDPRFLEIDRADTANLLLEEQQQSLGQVITQRWQCSSGAQTSLPPFDDNSCPVNSIDPACNFDCKAGDTITASIGYGALSARIHGHCGNGDAHCTTSLTGGCQDTDGAILTGNGPCLIDKGLVVSGGCISQG